MSELNKNSASDSLIPDLQALTPKMDTRAVVYDVWGKPIDKPRAPINPETLTQAGQACDQAQALCRELIEKLSGRKIALEDLLDFDCRSVGATKSELNRSRQGEAQALQGMENLLHYLKANPPAKAAAAKAEDIDTIVSEMQKPVNSLLEITATSSTPGTATDCERDFWESQLSDLARSTKITRLSLADLAAKHKDNSFNKADLVYMAQRLFSDLSATRESIEAFAQAKSTDWQSMQNGLKANPELFFEQETTALNKALGKTALNMRLCAEGINAGMSAEPADSTAHLSRKEKAFNREIAAISDSLKEIKKHALAIETIGHLSERSSFVKKASDDLASRLDEFLPEITAAEKLLEDPRAKNIEKAYEALNIVPESMGESYLYRQ